MRALRIEREGKSNADAALLLKRVGDARVWERERWDIHRCLKLMAHGPTYIVGSPTCLMSEDWSLLLSNEKRRVELGLHHVHHHPHHHHHQPQKFLAACSSKFRSGPAQVLKHTKHGPKRAGPAHEHPHSKGSQFIYIFLLLSFLLVGLSTFRSLMVAWYGELRCLSHWCMSGTTKD